MAITRPKVEWFYDPNTYFYELGLTVLGGKWAVIRSKDVLGRDEEFEVLADGLDSRETAIGFIKLLKEK